MNPNRWVPRGWFVFDGYAAQRQADLRTNRFGSLPALRGSLDAAAMYFVDPMGAGRGGYGGYLTGDTVSHAWLLSSADKMLVGYPIEGFGVSSGKKCTIRASGTTFSVPNPKAAGYS